MTDQLTEWLVATYDEVVTGEGADGATVEKARDAVAHAYADAVDRGEIDRVAVDVVAEGRDLFDRHIGRTRTRRRESIRKDMEYMLDALADETILGRHDPIFQQAYPLGDGRDKVLGLWTQEDWLGAAAERNSNVVAAAAAAHSFEVMAKAIVDRLRDASAGLTIDLFGA